jgi:hypothetical protein
LVPAEKLSKALIVGVERRRTVRSAAAAKVRTFLAVWGVGVALAALTVSRFAVSAQEDYQIDRLQAAYQAATQENLTLRSELTALTGPVRLEQIAAQLRYTVPATALVVDLPAAPAVAKKAAQPGFLAIWTKALRRLDAGLVRLLTAF